MKWISRVLKKSYIIFYKPALRCKWTFQFLILQLHKKNKTQKYNLLDAGRILIIVPHADDELIGCYKFMKSTDAKVCLFYCNMTGSNNDENNKDIRKKEFEELCHQNGFEYSISDGLIEQSMDEAIREYNPDTIMLPSVVDWHPQHREVNNIAKIVLNNMSMKPAIVWYPITVPIDSRWVNYYVQMSGQQQKEKWKMFSQVYKSQKNMPLLRFKYNERIAGKEYGEYAAEVFCTMGFDKWLDCLELNEKLVENQQSNLKSSINDLIQIRDKAAVLYTYMIAEGVANNDT